MLRIGKPEKYVQTIYTINLSQGPFHSTSRQLNKDINNKPHNNVPFCLCFTYAYAFK